MTTYGNLAQAAAALADPATSPRDLVGIAQAYPSLWIDVAAHPNTYPDLLVWLATVGDDTVRAAIAAREASPTNLPPLPPPPPPADEQPMDGRSVSTEAEGDSQSAAPERHFRGRTRSSTRTTAHPPTAGPIDFRAPDVPSASENPTTAYEAGPAQPARGLTTKTKRILIGSGAGLLAIILAVVLIVTLVVIPHKRAEEAAAAEQARLEQEHTTAVDDFTKAVDACAEANQWLADSLVEAQETVATDPSDLDDPSLIDALKQAIDTAQSVEDCVPPAMAEDTASIQQQTIDLSASSSDVKASSSRLDYAEYLVEDSVEDKKEKASSGSVDITDQYGYTTHLDFTDAAVITKISSTHSKPGYSSVRYALDVDARITNTTPDKVTPVPDIQFMPVYTFDLCESVGNPTGCYIYKIDIGGTNYFYLKSIWPRTGGPSLYMGKSQAWPAYPYWTYDPSPVLKYDPLSYYTYQSSQEVPESLALQFQSDLTNPAFWVVQAYSLSGGSSREIYGGSYNFPQ